MLVVAAFVHVCVFVCVCVCVCTGVSYCKSLIYLIALANDRMIAGRRRRLKGEGEMKS